MTLPDGITQDMVDKIAGLLANGRPNSTKTIMKRTKVWAIHTCIEHLRANGAEITVQRRTIRDKHMLFYTMMVPPVEVAEAEKPLDFMDSA